MANDQSQGERESHKQKLLRAYKEAVQEKNATQAIEILKQLDHHLTKAEAAKLMKSASEMFHRKLQTLGGQFSLAVTRKDWEHALKIGKEIIQDFPNSKMASEIHAKIQALEDKIKNKKNAIELTSQFPSTYKCSKCGKAFLVDDMVIKENLKPICRECFKIPISPQNFNNETSYALAGIGLFILGICLIVLGVWVALIGNLTLMAVATASGIIGGIATPCFKFGTELIREQWWWNNPKPRPRSALISVILAIFSVYTLCITAFIGLIYGFRALKEIKASGGKLGGKVMAISGITISSICILGSLFVISTLIYFSQNTNQKGNKHVDDSQVYRKELSSDVRKDDTDDNVVGQKVGVLGTNRLPENGVYSHSISSRVNYKDPIHGYFAVKQPDEFRADVKYNNTTSKIVDDSTGEEKIVPTSRIFFKCKDKGVQIGVTVSKTTRDEVTKEIDMEKLKHGEHSSEVTVHLAREITFDNALGVEVVITIHKGQGIPFTVYMHTIIYIKNGLYHVIGYTVAKEQELYMKYQDAFIEFLYSYRSLHSELWDKDVNSLIKMLNDHDPSIR